MSLISGIEKFYASEGYVTSLRRIFFVSLCRKISPGNPLVCHNFRVSNYFMLKRVMSRYFVEFFCLTVPKKFVGEPYRVSLISGIEKFYASEGYVTIFRRNFFVSLCRKIS